MTKGLGDRHTLSVQRPHDINHAPRHTLDVERKVPTCCFYPGGSQDCAWRVNNHVDVCKVARDYIAAVVSTGKEFAGKLQGSLTTRQRRRTQRSSATGDVDRVRGRLASDIGECRELDDGRHLRRNTTVGRFEFKGATGMPRIENDRAPSVPACVMQRTRYLDMSKCRQANDCRLCGLDDVSKVRTDVFEADNAFPKHTQVSNSIRDKGRYRFGRTTVQRYIMAGDGEFDGRRGSPVSRAYDSELHVPPIRLA